MTDRLDTSEPVALPISVVARRLPGVSERTLRAKVREIGCYFTIGRAIFMTEDDFQKLRDACRPRRPRVRLPEVEYEAARRLLAKGRVPPLQERKAERARQRLENPWR